MVELLVVIAIIGILVSLLLPAIQAAREAARRAQCQNHLKQIAIGFLNHESNHGFLPSSGWGYRWQGDPDRGYGRDQPGGWAYDVLAYIEEQSLRNIGRGFTGTGAAAEERTDLLPVVSTPVPVFYCPSRRPAIAYPADFGTFITDLANNLRSCVSLECTLSRTDYAGNSGNLNHINNVDAGPPSFAELDIYTWKFDGPEPGKRQTGITYQRSQVRFAQITDGTSHTAMVGEKYLNPDRYFDGQSQGDDQNAFNGHDWDANRWTAVGRVVITGSHELPVPASRQIPPLQDRAGYATNAHKRFGSAHPGGLYMAFCDGSVQNVAYDIDEEVWRIMGGRDDEIVVSN